MLWSAPNRKLRQIARAADDAPRGRSPRAAESEQRLKRRHGRFPAVVPKGEFVEIDLQMRAADAVVRADEPLLQVADRPGGSQLHLQAQDNSGQGP